MKTKYSITQKWERKIVDMKSRIELKYTILLKRKKEKVESNWEWQIQKLEKKKNAELRKKEEMYKRKMLNEIRILEGKPKREYKTDAPKIKPLQFALSLAQENARLRDTDADGHGFCISHEDNRIFERGELAGGHRYSRNFKFICLEKENINAQCHNCNYTTGPKGDTVAKEKTNAKYDENLDIKYGKGTAKKLKDKLRAGLQGKLKAYDLEMVIPALIEENEKLWATKNFHKPAKRWRFTWTKYSNRT